ncbi:MAG: hypothetical protein K2H85_08410 [Allobaculum sp.]|nr:hypothetical protein [Allobaculum sp.]
MSDKELNIVNNDGIWKVDFNSGEDELLVSIEELIKLKPQPSFENALHKVNHVMIAPDGKSFIFIHRWYVGHRRFDRLVFSDFKELKILSSEEMVSHLCWVDSNTLFGYLRHNGKDGFFFVNISSGDFFSCKELNSLGNGDGHPSCHGDWIVFDTYPDKSRMQHLYLYNYKSSEVFHLLELFHGLKYWGESRCDLHPRFSPDGRRVYFDTVYKGFRRLAWIDISSLVN